MVKRATKYGEWNQLASEVDMPSWREMNSEEQDLLMALAVLGTNNSTSKEREALLELKKIEVACVGAGIGGGFNNTAELKPMKYRQAMATSDKEKWNEAVELEHESIKRNRVWIPVKLKNIPKHAKILTSTWAMKKKANGTFRARINARGYEEIDGVHYDASTISAPVTNELTLRIMMVIMLMAAWTGYVLDVKGAFLKGEFEPGSPPIYMKIPEGFEKYYGVDSALKLLKTLYGLKEAAYAFWRQMLKAFNFMGFEKSKADPCLYFKWTKDGHLVSWLSRVDDCVCFGRKQDVNVSTNNMKELFECDDIGNFKEYVGCKVNHDGNTIRMTQPAGIDLIIQ